MTQANPRRTPYLFAATLFVSAALLFWVEPLVGKMVLPLLGGAPAVWNTCLVFFQAALLTGYLYAHASSTWLRPRTQTVLHLILLALALLVLPIVLSGELPAEADPVPWLLRLLTLTVGLPFVVVAGSAPLLQNWFAATGHAEGRDPYFLYAASNLGSMIALLGFPFLLEPTLPLDEQSRLWAGGCVLLLVLTAGCALCVWRSTDGKAALAIGDKESGKPLTWYRRRRWLLLSLVPSSLLLGVTTYVTTDLAAIPLLWVVPLALYLLSFVLVFARRPPLPHTWMVRLLPLLTLLVGVSLAAGPGLASWQVVPLHWLALFVVSMVCHGELAKDRPAPRYLTGFYLWLSLGGVLGGLVNVFLAPLLFQGRALEYPLALLVACLLTPGLGGASVVNRCLDVLGPCAVGLLALVMAVSMRATEADVGWLGPVLAFGVPLAVGMAFSDRPYHFAVPLVAAVLTGFSGSPRAGPVLYSERNFFGLLRVRDDDTHTFRSLNHGSTQHGRQLLGPDGKPLRDCPPTAYYHRSGPVGHLFQVFQARSTLPRRVAVIGLGAGAMASYAQRGEEWTFYELDPAMVRVARDLGLFTYLNDAERRGATIDIVPGDGRMRLQEAAAGRYAVIVQDAFSSDAVPTHLLTRQALRLYNARKAPGGLLVFNVSNRYLDLRPVLADLARDAGMVCCGWHDYATPEQAQEGKTESSWVVLADRDVDLGIMAQAPWRRLHGEPGRRVWEDDFSNLIQVFRFRSSP